VVGYVQCWLSFWQGVAVAPDGRIYVTEGSNCRVRRITPADVLAQNLQCSTRLVDVLRPGGCALYDPPVTVHDRMVSTLQLSSFHVTTCPLLT
jgi:glucose/arabinose dehydrogenase